MAKINLLPWREERRQELKKEFLVVLAGVVVLAVGLIFLVHTMMQGAIDSQRARNGYLTQNIKELELQVKEIKLLEQKRQELLDRMTVIQQLQGNRPVIVRVFDEVVKTLPDGVFYNNLKRTDKAIRVSGIAESNNRISSLMRKLETSEWFSEPNLTAVKATPTYGEQASSFSLSFKISSPSEPEKEK